MSYKDRMSYVEAVGLTPVDPSKPMDKLTYALWVLLARGAWQDTYRATYVPFDVETGEIPEAKPSWKKKTIHGENGDVALWTSPNLWLAMYQYFSHEVCGQKSPNAHGPVLPVPDVGCVNVIDAVPVLFVDYSTVIGFKYAGPNQPPERELKDQVTDWQNGVMLSRLRLPNASVPEETIQEFEQKFGVTIPRGYYWVAYQASLMTPPGVLLNSNRAVLAVTVEDECQKVLGIIKKCPKMEDVLARAVQETAKMVAPLGFVVDTTYEYTYAGQKLRGPYIVKNHDGTYTVLVPVVKAGSLGPELMPVVYVLVALAVIVIAIAFAVKVVRVDAIYAEADKKRAEAFSQYINFVTSACSDPNNPACQELLKHVTDVANATKPSGGSGGGGGGSALDKMANFIMLGVGAVVAVSVAKALSSK